MTNHEEDIDDPVDAGNDQPQTPVLDGLDGAKSMTSDRKDLSLSVNGMYPLLDLITEQGSSGLVDKIVISQQSLQEFINVLSPSAYSSITKVNFKILDDFVLKPLGIYGSKEEIVRFLREINAVGDITAEKLLIRENGDTVGSSEPGLRSGLYVVRSLASTSEEQAYVVYWPEETTWDDHAASSVKRNRVTFMRYLNKLCDQLFCLLSSGHSKALVLGSDDNDKADVKCDDDDDDDDNASTDSDNTDNDRFVSFKVAQTNDQEENVGVRAGFVMNSPLLVNQNVGPSALYPSLLHGEKVQGFMSATFVPAKKILDPFSYDGISAEEIRLVFGDTVALSLPGDLDKSSAEALITALSLRTRFQKEHDTWESDKKDTEHRYEKVLSQKRTEIPAKVKAEFEQLEVRAELEGFVVSELLELFPSLQRERFLTKSSSSKLPTELSFGTETDNLPGGLFILYPMMEQALKNAIRDADIESCLTIPEFQFKKKRIQLLRLLHSDSHRTAGVSTDQIWHVTEAILGQQDEGGILAVLETFSKDERRIISRIKVFLRSSTGEEELWLAASKSASSVSDSGFLSDLRTIPIGNYLHEAAIDAEEAAYAILRRQVDTLTAGSVRETILSTQRKQCDKQIQRENEIKRDGELKTLWSTFVRRVKDVSTQCSTPRIIDYVDHFEAKKLIFARDTYTYSISGRREFSQEDEIEYRIHLLHLRADESQKVQFDPSYVPTPILEKRLSHAFRVSSSTVVKYAHILEGDRILLALADPHGKILIYMESLSRIDAAIQRRSFAMQLHRDKIGETCLFAIDESKRLLAVYSSGMMQLHIFVFEFERGSLRGMGSAIELHPFYNEDDFITHACFVHGRDEILFVDSSAQARIFSLTMLQPKPAFLQLLHVPLAVYSSPDGSCVLVVQENEGVSTVTAYHWTTFASTDGISLTLPDFPVNLNKALLTSIVNRNSIHLIGLDMATQSCRSIILDITSKASEFTFQQQHTKASIGRGKETTHNCLIDCHSDVWTRFPVVAAVKRRTITYLSEQQQRTLTFVTDDDQRPFSSYFTKMIRNFTKTSRKPASDVLEGIIVSARTFTSFTCAFHPDSEWPVSRFRAGEWLADLLCLIPIHIAITQENRFVPLKDGVLSTELERSLLGAEVNRIVDSLSIGWYESIFQSYWASKPVKVVSSMGEQSVGKSFALNHLLDTSFAGSAMRTTEGVWLSVSPTDDALIVALDFEGVHSLERSAQEDTLLVLFNTAISNLVLFRNNFALGRDITGLFQSFQSSTSILDPESNPSLFQSTLLVIIKDVIDSDKVEVTKEFSLKFQKIVENERESNFITRLHEGNLNIIPWPVIESEGFYKLFRRVKKVLDRQPISHRTAGEFLLTLKTLMAKLKSNDWGAMSQTMAMHRASSLFAILPNALETGFSDIDPEPVPLKNFDTDLVIEAKDTKARFVLAGPNPHVEDHERALTTLLGSWDQATQRQYRDDSQWHSDLVQYLTHLVDLRVTHVKNWLESNVQRFDGVHASIEELHRTFNSAVIDLRASVEICRSQCSSCSLICVRSNRSHKDGHDCSTNHRCIHVCSFCERDGCPPRPCGQIAGHPGDHICRVGVHLCGEPCKLSGSRACTKTCVKPIHHEDDGGHLCSAPVHMCGQPCRLAGVRLSNEESFTCSGTCHIPHNVEHEDHQCENRECPASCQLCNRMCSGGHLHGLQSGEHHLCGKEHPCNALCTAGICEIQTKPQAIEATFVGTHSTFEYTRYTQVVKHLPCAKAIKPGEVYHIGPHIHANDNPFHYCDIRCGSCGYLCTLPFGHPQQEHETSHGSMSQTRWAVDEQDGTGLEIEGRKFSSNDDGSPMLCNLVCKSMGRHAHVDMCRGFDSHNSRTEHITKRISPNPHEAKDWITHSLHWLRMGFKDPYSREEQANFAKCDALCPGPEHITESGGARAHPSACTLPIFHEPLSTENPPPGSGYVSNDGHHFTCKNPALLQPAYHVIFVIDKSGSMWWADQLPLPNAIGTSRIIEKANNRLGAVFSSLYSFWVARQATFDRNPQPSGRSRKDSYSVILFDSEPTACVENDFTSSPEELLAAVLEHEAVGGTDFTRALKKTHEVMISYWSNERTPVVIFLSDGWCNVSDEPIYDMCRDASRRGKPLSMHTVAFGRGIMPTAISFAARWITRFSSLTRMVEIAQEIQQTVPQDLLTVNISSSFTEALDTVQLTTTFQGFAESLKKPRGHLISSRFSGNTVGKRLVKSSGDTRKNVPRPDRPSTVTNAPREGRLFPHKGRDTAGHLTSK